MRVRITRPAEQDVLANHAWWSKNRSVEQADRWLEGVYRALFALAESADLHQLANERPLRRLGIRQAAFGLGRRPSHRILFDIEDGVVVVYRVRAFKQVTLGAGDLRG